MKFMHIFPNLARMGLDTIVASIGLVTGIFILTESVITGNEHFHFFALAFFPSLLYLLFRKKMLTVTNLCSSSSNKNKSLFLIGGAVFFLSVSLLILLSHQIVYYRPPVYFLICLIASASILFHIFYSNLTDKRSILFILSEIIILAILIKASLYYEFPGFFGQDPWWHTQWIKETIEAGHITVGKYIINSYYIFPQFHLLNGMSSIVSSLTIHNATFFSVGFIGCSVIPALLLFLIAKRFIGVRAALLSTLIFSLSDQLIARGTSIIPMALGISFFLIICYLIFNTSIKGIQKASLLLLFSFSLILTHTIAAFVMFLSLLAILTSCIAYNKLGMRNGARSHSRKIITASFVIFFGTTMSYIWSLNSLSRLSFFDGISVSFINALQEESAVLKQHTITTLSIPYEVSLFAQTAFLILMFFAIIGSLIYFSTKERDIYRLGLVSLLIILYGIVTSFSFYSISVILPWRWYIFLMFPLSILGVMGLSKLLCIIRNNAARAFTTGLIIATIILFSLLSPVANQDTPPFFTGNSSKRMGWTQSELTGAEALYNFSCGRVVTDTYYGNIFPYIIGNSQYQEMLSQQNSVFIWRNYYLHHPEWNDLYVTVIHNGRNHDDKTEEKIFISDYMAKMKIITDPLIYANGNMKAYILKAKFT